MPHIINIHLFAWTLHAMVQLTHHIYVSHLILTINSDNLPEH